jgi:hypothetical protein
MYINVSSLRILTPSKTLPSTNNSAEDISIIGFFQEFSFSIVFFDGCSQRFLLSALGGFHHNHIHFCSFDSAFKKALLPH